MLPSRFVVGPLDSHATCACAVTLAVFYGCGWNLLGANMLFCAAVIPWVGGLSLLAVFCIKATVGLRVPLHVEEIGMDK